MKQEQGKLDELRSLLHACEDPGLRIGAATADGILHLDGSGDICHEPAFDRVFHGAYRFYAFVPSARVKEIDTDLIASLDDMAQILGYRVPCRSRGRLKGRYCAYLVKGEGILALGRTPKETATAIRMVQKALQVELAGRKLGGTRHLSPLLCTLEHMVYQKKYSRNEVQADR